MLTVLITLFAATEPCDPPRLHDPAPLALAMSQDRAMAQTFFKAASACAERGEACSQARLECSTLLSATFQRQTGFDEGVWLRDMLLPYGNDTYPMTRTIPPQVIAGDASCNVEVEALKAAAERRSAQAGRRDALFQEYAGYTKWAQVQHASCRDRVAAVDVRTAAEKAEAERLAAVAAAAAAGEAMKLQAQRDLQQAELARQREAAAIADREAQRQAELDKRQAAMEAQQKAEAATLEEKRKITERDGSLAAARAEKKRIVKEAEANLDRAKADEATKRKVASDAVNSSPGLAAAAVAEAAEAERNRRDAEQQLVIAQQKADAMELDESFEREAGSVFITVGGTATNDGLGMGATGRFSILGGAHFGFWSPAPSDGTASGFELRLWGKLSLGGPAPAVDSLLTARYFIGHFGFGLAGELRTVTGGVSLRGGGGPAVAVSFVDTPTTRVLLGVNYLPLGNILEPARLVGDFEISYRFFTLQLNGGTFKREMVADVVRMTWSFSATVGVRARW